MKCPKCDFDIDEKMLVCPNCKKVLKLVCPKCKTINQGNVCKKCGFSIITKCHKCGKINQTISTKCTKCGFNTYTSAAINSSNIDEFACLIISFTNLDDIKSALGSTKLYEKFKINLDKLVYDYAQENNLVKEIIEDNYVLRFNKDLSLSDSANNAVNGSIEILNSVTELNFKLNKLKGITLQCNIAILKRDINSQPEDYKSGFDIKMIYQGKDQSKLLSGLQVITDSSIYEMVCENFELTTLSSTFIKNQMVMFFELNIKKYVKIPKEEEKKEEDFDLPSLPVFDQEYYQEQNEIYNIDAINFDELRFNFINSESSDLINKIIEQIKLKPINIISVRGAYNLMPRTEKIMKNIEKLKKFGNVFKITCHDGLKYEPYGFFKELISDICNFSKAPRNFHLHNFEMFRAIDPHNYINNLINAKLRENAEPEESRKALFNIFFNLFSSIQGSMIIIEDFDKIDDSSFEILQLFFEKLEEFQISYITFSKKEFSLHKNAHFLLSCQHYTEIVVKPSQIKNILMKNPQKYKNILDGIYIKKIAQNFKGSYLFIDTAIDYLIETESLSIDKEGILNETDIQNTFIPPTLEDLFAKKLHLLSKDEIAYKFFVMLLLIDSRVDLNTINLLGIPDAQVQIQKLTNKNLVYIDDKSIHINNYNIIKNSFLNSKSNPETIKLIAQELISKILIPDSPTYIESMLYNLIGDNKEEFLAWQRLAKLNNSLGDFSSYVNCSNNFLNLANSCIENNEIDYKKEVYENISNLVHKYSPEKQQGILQEILNNFEQTEDNEKIITLCNKMLQGYLLNGNYQQAFNAIRRIFAKFPHFSINPTSEKYNAAFFFISLIKIEILFSIGNFKDCIEAANEILDVINSDTIEKIKSTNLSIDKFETTIFDSLCFAAFAKVLILDSNIELFIEKIKEKFSKIPQVFTLFKALNEVTHGNKVTIQLNISNTDEDRFSKILISLITAFDKEKDNYEKFAQNIHQAKVNAKSYRLFQIELACDLLIGYSYFKLAKIKKAASIYNNVLDSSEKFGLKTITQLAWYFLSLLKYEEGNTQIAIEIANNAVVKIEKDENSSDLLFFIFKMHLANILLENNSIELAKLSQGNAQLIKNKYGLNFDINLDFDKVKENTINENQNDIEQNQDTQITS